MVMKEIRYRELATAKDFEDLLKARTGFTREQCKIFLEAYAECLKDCLFSGIEVKLLGFGIFKLRDLKPREGATRISKLPRAKGATMVIRPVKERNKIFFQVEKEISEKMRELTDGNPFMKRKM